MTSKPRVTYIYGLQDPRTDSIRYIGKTTKTPEQRFVEHKRKSSQSMQRWFEELSLLSLEPKRIELEAVPEPYDWRIAEICWIKDGRRQGWDLLNTQRGGDDVSDGSVSDPTIFGSKELMTLLGEVAPGLCSGRSTYLSLLTQVLRVFESYEKGKPAYTKQHERLKAILVERLQSGARLLNLHKSPLEYVVGVGEARLRKNTTTYYRILSMNAKTLDYFDELASVRVDGYRRGHEATLMGALGLFKGLCLEAREEVIKRSLESLRHERL